jgi:hypothetical protein
MGMVHRITHCRICRNADLLPVIELGEQALTGVFPRRANTPITKGPLDLVRCHAGGNEDHCGLVQLRHSYDLAEMYGENYGYRSSLNRSMVNHLNKKVAGLLGMVPAGAGDVVLDIGSNDGTLLAAYPRGGATLVGMDPTIVKFRQHYRDDIQPIADFFSSESFRRHVGDREAKIVTSIAMFYDLEDPLAFMQQVASILAPDGIWHFEQSYLPSMLATTAYDTICHEHLEYYALRQIEWLAGRAGLKVIDVELNDVNGGSFAVTAAKATSEREPTPRVAEMREAEKALGLLTEAPYAAFVSRVTDHARRLRELLLELKAAGKAVMGYGASTKGNVILQYCRLSEAELPRVAEVNPEKFGCFTPGTHIPIVSEAEAKKAKPDYFLVMPWHFRKNVIEREADYLRQGGRLIFPLPELEIVSADGIVRPAGRSTP